MTAAAAAAAAAKSLQSCPTLCDHTDGSPPGSLAPGILQARTLEWAAISFSNPLKDVLFIIGDGNAKVGSQEIPGVTGKFGLGVQNEGGQRLTVLSGKHSGHSKHPLLTTQEMTLPMDITKWSI